MNKIPFWGVALCLLVSCKKEGVDLLPKATQEGKNTAGFLADGKAFTPNKGGGFVSGTNPVNGYREKTKIGTVLAVSFSDRRGQRQEGLGIRLLNVRQPGTYVLEEQQTIILANQSPGYLVYYSDLIDREAVFYSGPGDPATVTITRLDTINNIVSGTFEAVPRENGGSRTVQITKGRFDVKYDRK
ncbi:hypothetical protein CDA63_15415 [Hymenobacter amundsenii]|uniref:Uncharacterized protein n=1 Tax=Hymenobacter amundsenii TaxID=2006685 RepID=A0A246FI60_9BACT|nr:hypothetical protein [Hymenobacter amundsenii]OWP62206.1 hypothetical protein CDA63_15415 [Hymenobacter amundsenii]